MKNLKELEQKYLELGKEIEALKKQSIEKEEVKYPIYCKSKSSLFVVKFQGLHSGEVIISYIGNSVGYKSTTWVSHTDSDTWQQLEVCEKTGFFDGQLVWCWNKYLTHIRHLRFYDTKNKCTYSYNGDKDGGKYDNYEPFEGNYPDWALEAFQTLER